MGFVMIAETVDYSEWMTGVRAQGLFTAVAGFMVKLGMAVAGAVSAAVMAHGGYVENAVQSASSLAAIRMNYIWIPVGIAAISVVISLFYDLDKKYGQVIAELHERRKQKNA
jgi:GPH family glycoside/pentoside/hexuronide:cation symporter